VNPLPGEHTEDILRKQLGHDQEAMKKLNNKNDNKQSGKLWFEFCMQSYKRKTPLWEF
jgi:hypothetical protein